MKRATDGRRSDNLWRKQLCCGLVHLDRTVRQLKEENGRLEELTADWSFGMLAGKQKERRPYPVVLSVDPVTGVGGV